MKILHYINQFYAQIGGEDKADYPMEVRETIIGPGVAIKAAMGDKADIIATVICGDNYFNENLDAATQRIQEIIAEYKPDIVIAGPAFNAGRYGMACGNVLKIANEAGIPAVSGMYPENPGADMFRRFGCIVKTRNSAVGMKNAVKDMVNLAEKLLTAPRSLDPKADNYIPRGIRINRFAEKTGAQRSIEMLLKKLNGEPYETELPMPVYNRVSPAPAIKDLSRARIALVTTGGVVPKGNPDRIESAIATKYKKYPFSAFGSKENLVADMIHGGCDPIYAAEDPDRMLPADVLADMEKEGIIGELYDFVYTTSGNGCSTANSLAFGQSIAKDLIRADVDGILLTSA